MMKVRRMKLIKRKQDAASLKYTKLPLSSENLTCTANKKMLPDKDRRRMESKKDGGIHPAK